MQIIALIAARLTQLWRFWMADIRKRGCAGKVISLGVGLFAILCACTSVNLAVGNVGQRIGVVATWTPTSVPPATEIVLIPTATAVPKPTITAVPTVTVPSQPTTTSAPAVPTATSATNPTTQPRPTSTPIAATSKPAPTEAPATTAPEPTPEVAPTEAPATSMPEPTIEPTAQPVVSDEPTYTEVSSGRRRVDPPYWPCKEAQIKGNNKSGIFHVPTGRDYAFTFADVTCFDTADAATAAGFRQAQR